jgi:hypothetical protein
MIQKNREDYEHLTKMYNDLNTKFDALMESVAIFTECKDEIKR